MAMLVLVHTVTPLLDLFIKLGCELLPDVGMMHVLDELLLERVRQRGRLAARDVERLAAHVAIAQEIGADALLVTCSTISPCVDEVRRRFSIPLIKIDEAMIAEAVARGSRIGVVATNPTTLEPTRRSLQAEADALGKAIDVEMLVVPDALRSLLAGDAGSHDRLVEAAILDLAPRVDVVMLAQASTARVLDVLTEVACPVAVLSSPHLALRQVSQMLGARSAGRGSAFA